MKNKPLIMIIVILIIATSSVAQTGIFTDTRDGKTYKTIKIGTQTWMAKNLAYKTKSGCWAYKNDLSKVTKYGYLYDWETAKKACPSGWHLPTDEEWIILTNQLEGKYEAGGKLKSKTGWNTAETINTKNDNSSGFSALPGGLRDHTGQFGNLGVDGYWWSSTEKDGLCIARNLNYNYFDIGLVNSYNVAGLSVRCLSDK